MHISFMLWVKYLCVLELLPLLVAISVAVVPRRVRYLITPVTTNRKPHHVVCTLNLNLFFLDCQANK